MNPESALENLARFVEVIGSDQALRQRFRALATASDIERANQVHILAERMAAEGTDPELVKVFRLFADPRIFNAAVIALQQCGYAAKKGASDA